MKKYAPLALFVLLCLGAGALGSIATASSVSTWYPGLLKPSWKPPSWLFGPVWTLLYVLMGSSAWRVWLTAGGFSDAREEMILFFVQLTLNVAWSWIFFGLRMPGAALLELVLLWVAIAVTIRAFARMDRIAAWLMVPYIAWVTYAGALNASIWFLNR
ncbi:MAG: TspO/MBR family protein [Thermovirgaceae bacterium]|nr:tryptophan-rich sensory protein [Synergistales bacterium]MDI9393855.1 TspO/MBR family protein [Synergistota bacterium]HRW87144.1 tryptophan-rich sensory protein [Thermovirgaceae bacterium]MDD3133720.1 tryptophan-rich sensory protein [Synergistales bacterium]MDD3830272.1 tryptophan-rich sensory protein [Synergistales bacterium]